MKILIRSLSLLFFTTLSLFSQENKASFDVHKLLYYENEECSSEINQAKYSIIYQNLYDHSKFITYNLNSFQDENINLFVVNQHKVMSKESYPHANFNVASRVEVAAEGIKNMNDLSHLPNSKVSLKFVERENLIRENRMLTAYHFKAKNFDNAKKIIYYIDHGSNSIPFSYHESFYDEMKSESFPLIGDVVQRDEISSNGTTCSYVLKRSQNPKKEFNINFIE